MNKNRSAMYFAMLVIGIVVLMVCSSFSGYYAREPSKTSLITYLSNIDTAIFKVTWNEYTPKILGAGILIYAVGCMYFISTRKNYRFGEEFGSASFATAREICSMYEDKKRPENNRLISKNVKLSYDSYKTQINNHMLIMGGSGAGKTRSLVKPNIMQLHGSMVVADPNGDTLRSTGHMLIKNGYKIRVLNLVDMSSSDCYNPFRYIESDQDVMKFITNLIKNTTPPDSQKGDPFWEDSTATFLQAIMYYIFYHGQSEEKNWNTVMEMINYASLKYDENGNRLKTPLDMLFEELKKEHPDSKALVSYEDTMGGADDTVRSILQSTKTRLKFCQVDGLKHIFSGDSVELEKLALEKTALFCIIPEDDDSFNFVMGMFYTQMYQVLFRIAKRSETSRVPLDVTVWMDEFANVALPDNFRRILSTARKYGINIVIILQSLSQLKPMFKNDAWEDIPDNCDTHIYLGGNSDSTFKKISGIMGKQTINKRSFSISHGARGNSSTSEDVTGRELLSPDEVRRMKNNQCILFIRGCAPVLDKKYNIKNHPNYRLIADSKKGKPYRHKVIRIRNIEDIDIDFNNIEML